MERGVEASLGAVRARSVPHVVAISLGQRVVGGANRCQALSGRHQAPLAENAPHRCRTSRRSFPRSPSASCSLSPSACWCTASASAAGRLSASRRRWSGRTRRASSPTGLANQLAEVGVILLMFGVGLHFSLKDLLSVRAIAVPGAHRPDRLRDRARRRVAWMLGWSIGAGLRVRPGAVGRQHRGAAARSCRNAA